MPNRRICLWRARVCVMVFGASFAAGYAIGDSDWVSYHVCLFLVCCTVVFGSLDEQEETSNEAR